MLRWIKRLILPIVGLLIVIQVFRPSRTNPPINTKHELGTSLAVDPSVASVFARSCNDCHSNRTVWPWYSQVAPASWLVVSDVNRGRAALNFSEWGMYAERVRQKHLAEVCNEVKEGEMPGLAYTVIHRNARLRDTEIAAVCRWTQSQRKNLPAFGTE